SMTTGHERVRTFADRLSMLCDDKTLTTHIAASAPPFYDVVLKLIGGEHSIGKECCGPDVGMMLDELDRAATARNTELEPDEVVPPAYIPSEAFFHSVGFLAFGKQPELADFDVLLAPLGELVSDKAFRAGTRPSHFSWCIRLLEKLIIAMDEERTSGEFFNYIDLALNALFFYLHERKEPQPLPMLIDNARRLITTCNKMTYEPKYWPIYVRQCVTNWMQPKDSPWRELCYTLVQASSNLLSFDFWKGDQHFMRMFAYQMVRHWNEMLNETADLWSLETVTNLFKELYETCALPRYTTDQTASCITSFSVDIMEVTVAHIRKARQNVKYGLDSNDSLVVCKMMRQLITEGDILTLMKEKDVEEIVDWWLDWGIKDPDAYWELMLSAADTKKLDGRFLTGMALCYESCVKDIPHYNIAQCPLIQTVNKLLHKERRTDFTTKKEVLDCIKRLDKIGMPAFEMHYLKTLVF
ncbi:hypothetical protein PFISCL1PPCAC_12576, partial [Pristionchus fissidentatus]